MQLFAATRARTRETLHDIAGFPRAALGVGVAAGHAFGCAAARTAGLTDRASFTVGVACTAARGAVARAGGGDANHLLTAFGGRALGVFMTPWRAHGLAPGNAGLAHGSARAIGIGCTLARRAWPARGQESDWNQAEKPREHDSRNLIQFDLHDSLRLRNDARGRRPAETITRHQGSGQRGVPRHHAAALAAHFGGRLPLKRCAAAHSTAAQSGLPLVLVT